VRLEWTNKNEMQIIIGLHVALLVYFYSLLSTLL